MNKYQQRNDEMARLHVHEGWTYEAIGKRFGISRERVRQILQRADAVDQKRTRVLRLEKRTLAIHASQAEFDERAGTGIRALLIEGVAPGEIARRLSILGPMVSEEQVRSFADRHHVPMPKAQAAHFADPALRIAVLAAVAATAGLRPDPIDALRMGSVELALLVEACASVTEMEEAAALACCARRNRDALTISQTGYSRWRDAWLDRFPKSGLYPWPVTSQTIMKRLGGGFWNDALRDIGLGLSARGRSRGRVIYTGDDDYEDTMAAFVAQAVDAGMRPVAREYERWAAGRPVPSWPAARGYFGSWARALQVGLVRSGRTLPRRGVAVVLEADRLVDLHIEQLQRLFAEATDRVIQEAPRSEAMRRHKDTVADVVGDLVSVFETFRRRWLIAALREDPKGFLANIEPNGRASNKERRAWEAVDQRPVRDVVEAVVDERGLDALLSAVGGDLCDDGGWLAPSQRSRLQRIDPRESARWRALKAARNCLEHRAVKTVQVLADALAQLDPESDSALMVRTPPSSAANVVRWLAAEVGAPSGHSSATRLHRSRLSHLYAMLVRVTKAMRSIPLDSSTAGDPPSNERS